MFDNLPTIMPHVKANSLRGLAVTTLERISILPEMPTIAETVPGFEVLSWLGFFVPAKTPRDIISKINFDTNAVLTQPSIKQEFENLGATAKGSTPAELAAFLQLEIEKWGPLIRSAQIKVEH